MPVFESTATDVFEPDPNEAIFGLPSSTNRHRGIGENTDSCPIVRYFMRLLESDAILERMIDPSVFEGP
jgi:hypothetical protein